MKLFPGDENVEIYKTGFEFDVLDRGKISKQLSDLVERIENPVVFALDDTWGSGKSYFLKRWVAAHKNENGGKAVTVYFDAFESDYLVDPLVAIITAVSERIPDDQRTVLDDWKSVAAKLAKPAFGVALSLATFGAKQHLEDIGDVVAEAVSSEAADAAKNLWIVEKERKQAVLLFKALLKKLTKDSSVPVVIVVDELDRCRPDYALAVLEIIKHFFAVPKVHFILGVNSTALTNSVKARYGDAADAEGYLKKFINVSFSLPRTLGERGEQSVIGRYCSYLIEVMELPDEIAGRCANLILKVASKNDVSLRDVGKIFSRLVLVPKEVFEKKILGGWIDILCILVVCSVINPKLHKKLLVASATTEELREFLGAAVSKTVDYVNDEHNEDYDHNLAFWLVTVIYACGSDTIDKVDQLPTWTKDIGKRFDHFGFSRDPKGIAQIIQKDWVEVFRV